MRIAVCIKQVADTEARLRLRKDGLGVDEEDLPFVMNPNDAYALEEALAIVERTGGEVVAFSLGGERVRETLRKALALGAQRAVHLDDPAFGGGDALATGRALAAAIQFDASGETGPFDLILTGSQSDDAGYSATGSVLAGHLGWPHAWLVMGVELEEGNKSARVTREMESGVNELVRIALPAVIEVQAGINQPRYASLKGIMQAKKKELASRSAADIGLGEDEVGSAGSRLETLAVFFPKTGADAEIFEGDPAESARLLIDKLQKEARVL